MAQVVHSFQAPTNRGTSFTLVPDTHKPWHMWHTSTWPHTPWHKWYTRSWPPHTMTQVARSFQAPTNHDTSGTLEPGPQTVAQVIHSYQTSTNHGTSGTLVPGTHRPWHKWYFYSGGLTMPQAVHSCHAPTDHGTSGTLVPGPPQTIA